MKKVIVSVIAAVMITVLFAFGASATSVTDGTTAAPSPEVQPSGISQSLSPAVDIIAANSPMARSGLSGKTIAFSRDDFARAMNLFSVDSITVVSLPAATDGVLLLGNTLVSAGQRISGDAIGHLTFDPVSDGAGQSSFAVSVNDSAYSVTCSLYMLASLNANPTVSTAAQTMLAVNGYESTAVFGKLGAYDPEGDTLTFEIVDAPDNGIVIMTDRSAGSYTYLPEHGFTGRDSFTYVVHDKYGNYSASAKVNVNIARPATSVVYTDMKGSAAACAAISMTENGIMSGSNVGELCYFYPDSTVSRVDFLVMAMNAAGIKDLPSATETGFFDQKDIPASALPYVAAAKRLGYIEGVKDKSGNLCFAPSEELTRAEAAQIVDKIMNGSSYLGENAVAPVFLDASEIPEWAKSSVLTLSKLGILQGEGGRINAADKLTRGDTAVMLDLMMQIIDK